MSKLDFIMGKPKPKKKKQPIVAEKKLTLPIYVIAGEYLGAQQWAIDLGIKLSDWRYLWNSETFRGRINLSCHMARVEADTNSLEQLSEIVRYAETHNFKFFTDEEIGREYITIKWEI